MTTQTLPVGWQRVALEAVLEVLPSGSKVQQGWSPQCEMGPAGPDDWGVLKTTAIQAGAFLDYHHKRLPEHFDPRPALEVRAGDLLLTNAGPRARCAVPCLVRSTRARLMLSGKFYRFRTQPSIMDPRFLEYFLVSPATQHSLDLMKTGISESGLNLTRGKFLSLPVVVPPLSEQRRIVDLLEGQLSCLDAAGSNLGDAERGLQALRASQLEAVRREAIAVGNVTPLGDLALDARYGTSAKCVSDGPGVPVVRIPNLINGMVDLTQEKRVQDSSIDTAALMLATGDVLVVRTNGSRDLIGRAAVVQPGIDAAFASYLIRYRLDQSRVSPAWVWAMFEAPSTRESLQAMAASSAGQYNLGLKKLDRVMLPVPPLSTQLQLLKALDDVLSAGVRLASQLRAERARATALRSSLLSAAFEGRLAATATSILELAHV